MENKNCENYTKCLFIKSQISRLIVNLKIVTTMAQCCKAELLYIDKCQWSLNHRMDLVGHMRFSQHCIRIVATFCQG